MKQRLTLKMGRIPNLNLIGHHHLAIWRNGTHASRHHGRAHHLNAISLVNFRYFFEKIVLKLFLENGDR